MLSLLIFFPLLGALAAIAVRKAEAAKWIALITSIITFAISLVVYANFNAAAGGYQLVDQFPWIVLPGITFTYFVGVDGMSMLLILLTTFLSVVTIFGTWNSITKSVPGFMALLMLLETGMLGVFCSLDLFLFYIFWEVILIPMYFIIGVWGGKRRIYAAIKFFIYTMAGSLIMLVAIIWLGIEAGHITGHFTTDITKLLVVSRQLPIDVQHYLFLAFALSFAIKVPIFPLHTWLPDAHTEAPTAGSVILAGVLLKMGTYGLIRFCLELFPQAAFDYSTIFSVLGVIGIIYGALVSMVQTDVKRLIAYSSVAHMGFIVLGIFSMTREGLQGAVIQMINHGLSTGMLFMMFGMMYDRRHTREISEYGGLARMVPLFSVFFGIAIFASAGLPGLNGFIGEYLTIVGSFYSPVLNTWAYGVWSATGVILAAVYLLWMYQRFVFGLPKGAHPAASHGAEHAIDTSHEAHRIPDLHWRELVAVVPIVIFMFWIGIQPMNFMKTSERTMYSMSDDLLKMKQASMTATAQRTLEKDSLWALKAQTVK
ncbi:MAG TPA: NADH-quinone oxidoreductase subunit M [Candidatus Kapabacteria bacterium]|nr:NADH-quinone oxidoreductase subunit M [Candidatus Kapabacteria bacterium]